MPEFTGGHDLIVTTDKLHPVTFKKRGTKKTPVSDHETLINSRIIHRLLYFYRLLHLPSLRDTTALDLRFSHFCYSFFFKWIVTPVHLPLFNFESKLLCLDPCFLMPPTLWHLCSLWKIHQWMMLSQWAQVSCEHYVGPWYYA